MLSVLPLYKLECYIFCVGSICKRALYMALGQGLTVYVTQSGCTWLLYCLKATHLSMYGEIKLWNWIHGGYLSLCWNNINEHLSRSATTRTPKISWNWARPNDLTKNFWDLWIPREAWGENEKKFVNRIAQIARLPCHPIQPINIWSLFMGSRLYIGHLPETR